FERLVTELELERDLSYHPLVQVLFTLQNMPFALPDLPGLTVEALEPTVATAKVDLSLGIEEIGDGLHGQFEYDAALFDRDRIERMAGHLTVLLEGIATDPERRLSELPLLPEAERRLVVETWNQTEVSYSADRIIPARVEEQARHIPGAVAVVAGDRQLSYGELNAQANQLARELRARGVGPGGIVAVLAERSPELVVGLLGAMKAGAAYLPLDPAYPSERLAFMLDDSGAVVLLTGGGLESLTPDFGRTVIRLDADRPMLAHWPDDDLGPLATSSDLAYVIYTSGSTGRPKAVEIPHRGLANLVSWHQREYRVTPADRATQVAGLAFDASVWELWPYLSAGASIRFPDDATRADVAALVRWLVAERITLTFLPTPLAELAIEEAWPSDCVLRAMLTGGDRLRRAPERDLPFTLVNHYGPTENSVVSTAIAVPPDPAGDAAPPIGRPIANTQTYILDPHRQPVPVGVPGELYVGGDSLARGYLHQPALTAERFIANPFSPAPTARLYRTGDLTRWRPDGAIEFLGRIDQQVKIHGFRVEPGEIEATLARHPAVRETVVIAREDQPGVQRLVGYVVFGAEPPPTVDELRAFLKRQLPDYMVPAAFVRLDGLPLTPNGKLDRQALPAPEVVRADEADGYVAPRTPTERTLAEIWGLVLGIEDVGIHDNFFDLGGDSILSMQVVARARQAGLEIHPTHLFQHDTIAELAPLVTPARASKPMPAPAEVSADEPRQTPQQAPLLTLNQRQLDRILARVSVEKEPQS
ncbi:MAG: amino acid adenylation domain-containing protein, partial [Chloroflexi bacterium]|nr:amino acid adenylation domain-containing protein [Chloroflexota bacterium]